MEFFENRRWLLKEIFRQGFRTPDWRHKNPPPAVPLELFFEGNPDKYSIATNLQDRHPGLDYFYEKLKAIRSRSDVKEVLANIYDLSDVINDSKDGWPYSSNIHILSSASQDEIKKWEKDLFSDVIRLGWPYGKAEIASNENDEFKWWCVCWD